MDKDEIDLRVALKTLFKGRKIIILVTIFSLLVSAAYSLYLPNIYQSQALLAPNELYSNNSNILQNYSGLAGLAGVNLPTQNVDNNSAKAIKKIQSLNFFENNIFPKIYLPDLMALKSWDPNTNNYEYDDGIFDKKTGKWIRKFSYPQRQIPSPQESFLVFNDEHLTINEDKKSGFVSITVKHQSPYIAKEWVELMVDEINLYYRQKDKSQSEKSVNYLQAQISNTNLTEIKQVIAALLQKETQKLTLIEANDFYVYEYIENPVVMERKSEPRRALICIFGSLLGLILSFIIVLSRNDTSN